ncbi:FAD-dependent oxidoreductase [Sinorhizobium terangae]|uniref:FAD-dependent oxidoreductase n=1 Tax=Sinorhizobium terangae TaxID=110322 RepID=A0A6N7LLW9_SINTE|nr:FAD-dependent oxidoreductase [Sinorhizobium terangae]MQX18873.1 FAD-dependent oxidoreductase [Sinorhizobium terangae]
MTRRLLIIGGGIQGMMSASAAAKVGTFSEIMVTEQGFGCMGASHYSGGVQIPYGRQDRTRSLTRKSAMALATIAGSDVNGWYRSVTMRVAAGPEEAIDPAQFTEPLEAAEPDMGSLAPSFSDSIRFWSIGGAHVADVPALVVQLQRDLAAKIRMKQGLRCVSLRERDDAAEAEFATGEIIKADAVILAVGPWIVQPPFRELSETFSIRIKKVVALHLERTSTLNDPLIFMPGVDAFLLPQPRVNRWLFSYASADWDVRPETVACGLSRSDLEAGRAVLERFCPGLGWDLTSGRVFCDAYSPTGAPVVARLTAQSRIILVGCQRVWLPFLSATCMGGCFDGFHRLNSLGLSCGNLGFLKRRCTVPSVSTWPHL